MADNNNGNRTVRECLEIIVEYLTNEENGFICRECGSFLNEDFECWECD